MPETLERELVHVGVKVPAWLKNAADQYVERKRGESLQPYSLSSLVRDALNEYLINHKGE